MGKNIKRTLLVLLTAVAIGTGSGCATTGETAKEPADPQHVVINADGSEYNPAGFKAPDLTGFKVLLKEYAKMSEESIPQSFRDMYKTDRLGVYNPGQFDEDEEHSLVYIVQFENKQGVMIEKFYHKTHPFAFTIREPGKKPYTIMAGQVKGAYCLKIPLELKYEKYDTDHWILGHPEPDDFNPNTDDPFPERDPEWYKACEWHRRAAQ
jgi:hypothetical protein